MLNRLKLQKERHNPKIRHLGMIVVLILLLVSAFIASIVVSASMFSRMTREYREEIITKTSKLATEQIDGDKIVPWLESGADEAYMVTAKLLQSICNHAPYVQYLYVYQIRPDGCHVVFDLETMADELIRYDEIPDISTDSLGTVIDFDESFADYIPTLLAGGQIDIIESKDTYGWLLTR